jgi:hypothetical protein
LLRDGRKRADNHFLEESFHTVTLEGRSQANTFIEDTPQTPEIGLAAVRLIHPDLRTSIVWGTCLGVAQPRLSYLGDIQVS